MASTIPKGSSVVQILGYGTIGLGFLLAFLAYRLLNREQSIESPREGILKAISKFMIFSFSLCGLGLSSELAREYFAKNDKIIKTLNPVDGSVGPLTIDELNQTRDAAERFLNQLDAGDYQQAYDGLPNNLKMSLRFSDFREQATSVSAGFGVTKDRKFDGSYKGRGQGPEGMVMYYTINFRANYENALNAADSVTFIRDDNANFRVVYYSRRR
jgi:hypothetical protein